MIELRPLRDAPPLVAEGRSTTPPKYHPKVIRTIEELQRCAIENLGDLHKSYSVYKRAVRDIADRGLGITAKVIVAVHYDHRKPPKFYALDNEFMLFHLLAEKEKGYFATREVVCLIDSRRGVIYQDGPYLVVV